MILLLFSADIKCPLTRYTPLLRFCSAPVVLFSVDARPPVRPPALMAYNRFSTSSSRLSFSSSSSSCCCSLRAKRREKRAILERRQNQLTFWLPFHQSVLLSARAPLPNYRAMRLLMQYTALAWPSIIDKFLINTEEESRKKGREN